MLSVRLIDSKVSRSLQDTQSEDRDALYVGCYPADRLVARYRWDVYGRVNCPRLAGDRDRAVPRRHHFRPATGRISREDATTGGRVATQAARVITALIACASSDSTASSSSLMA